MARKPKNNKSKKSVKRALNSQEKAISNVENKLRNIRASSNGVRRLTRELAFSMANPFESVACIPDGATSVGCFSVKQSFTLSTGVGGSCVWFAQGAYPYAQWKADGNVTPTTTSVPSISGDWAAATQVTNIGALYANQRMVSGGIRGTYIGNTQTDGGIIICGRVSGRVSLNSFTGTSLTAACALFLEYEQYPLRNGFSINWLPETETDMSEWAGVNDSALSTGSTTTRPYNLMIVYGANASQGLLQIDMICNYEGQFKSQTFLPGGLTDINQKHAEPGWYGSVRDLLTYVPAVKPMVGTIGRAGMQALRGNYLGAIGTLANGFSAPGLLSKSGMPKLLR